MPSASGVRIGWDDLPDHVRAAVAGILGAPVVQARSQPGGFSPGSADRVATADGRRAFVKAVSGAQNEHSPSLHRQEAVVTGALPADAPAPALLGCYDDGDWVALVLEDVEGRHPMTPWDAHELAHVLDTLEVCAARLTPSLVPKLPLASEHLASDFGGWERLRAEPWPGLDPWAAARVDQLCGLARRGLDAVAGDTVVHIDLRADNLLVGADGRVTLVDWPHACQGAAWLDTLLLLVNVRLFGGHDVDALLRRRPLTSSVDPDVLSAVLVALSGYFLDAARNLPPPGLPTVRAFQAAQGEATLSWVRQRT